MWIITFLYQKKNKHKRCAEYFKVTRQRMNYTGYTGRKIVTRRNKTCFRTLHSFEAFSGSFYENSQPRKFKSFFFRIYISGACRFRSGVLAHIICSFAFSCSHISPLSSFSSRLRNVRFHVIRIIQVFGYTT